MRKLVWAEEFNYTGLPDTTKWSYEEGLVRNKEAQYYTRSRKENAWVQDGYLTITARKEAFGNRLYINGNTDWRKKDSLAAYTSAAIITKNKVSWKYGRIEVRARVPKGKGVWPAIWMLGDNIDQTGWPKCGEIDILEYVGFEPDHIYGTVHFSDTASGKHTAKGNRIIIKDPFDDFHLYTMEWDQTQIKIYCDNRLFHVFDTEQAGKSENNPFRNPHYLLINLALGGSWGGQIDEDILPQQFILDYVRVYQ
jgi:beta-glucanase (GH16 family)